MSNLGNKPQLIALYSPVMQSGKTQIANALQLTHGFQLVKFAGPVKAVVKDLLQQGGAPEALAERMVEGDLKERPIPSLGGRSAREMLQTLGTDWGRDLVHPDLWLSIAMTKAEEALKLGTSVVIDDMRFPNEYEAVIARGGHVVKVVRAGNQPYRGHASEGLLDSYPMTVFHNNAGLSELRLDAERLPGLLRG